MVRSVCSRAPAVTLPPGTSAFCRTMASRTAVMGMLVGRQPVGVDPDVDRPLAGRRRCAPRPRRPSARAATLTILSAISVSSRSERSPESATRQHGRAVVVELGDDRRVACRRGRSRTTVATRSRTSWAAASMSRSRLKVAMTNELPARRDRAQLLDALDRVDGLLDGLGDLRSPSPPGEAPGSGVRTETVGRSTDGKRSTPRPVVAGGADHHEGEDDHGREDRPADADLGELLHQDNHLQQSHPSRGCPAAARPDRRP